MEPSKMGYWKDYFQLPNQGLRLYFDRVRSGDARIIRAPWYKRQNPQDVLKSWMKHLAPIQAEWPTLFEFEVDLAHKVGPLSYMKPLEARMKDIDSYYDSISSESEPVSAAAIAETLEYLQPIKGLRIRSQDKTIAKMELSKNSGSPYFRKKRTVIKETVPVKVLDLTPLDVLTALPSSEWLNCAVLGWRGQEGGPTADDVKQRVVWMYPFGLNVLELSLYQPLIEACQKHNLVPAWVGNDAVDNRITQLFDTKGDGDLVICTDFTAFDQHFGPDLASASKSILSELLTPNAQSEEWLERVFPIKYMLPLAYDWNKVRHELHGMASGSGGTNADETLAHMALQREAAILQGQQLNVNSMCLGDDGILSYPHCDVNKVVRSYTSHGLEMNESKQYASPEDCTYLRRWHHRDYRINGACVGVYSTCRALGRLCYQERFYDPEIWGPKMVELRQLSILENIKFHPLREEFVDFVMKGDKYRLGLDIPGFFDNLTQLAKDAESHITDFVGYTKSTSREYVNQGIDSWWIVQYLKSMK